VGASTPHRRGYYLDSPEKMRLHAVNLLWTGGWDSTFRLLQLVLVQARTVEPYYLIDDGRKSTNEELRAMENIRKALVERYPAARALLLPAHFEEVSHIPPDAGLTAMFQRIRNRIFMGQQYEWLPRFCAAHGAGKFELCIGRGDEVCSILKRFVIPCGTVTDPSYRVDDRFKESDEYGLFQFFRFPIYDLGKLDMACAARQAGFADLLELTWFCLEPRTRSRPCGACNPCRFAVEEGLGRRIPFVNRMRYHLRVRSRVRGLLARTGRS
jgi:hypothetical protein